MRTKPAALTRALSNGRGNSPLRIGTVDSVDVDGDGLPRAWVDLGDGNLIEALYGDHIPNLAADDVVRVWVAPGVTHLVDRIVEANPERTDWTPAFTALTVGDGTMIARYRVRGREMPFNFQFTLGASSTIGTNPKIGLPSGWTIYDDGVNQSRVPFVAMAFDSSASQWYSGAAVAGDAGNDVLTTRIIFGSTAVAAGTPFTWAAGDILMIAGIAEVQPV